MPDVAALDGLAFPRSQLCIGGHHFNPPVADKGVAPLLTATSWLLGQLPHQVVQHQRPALVKALAQARNLTVEVGITPEVVVRVRDGARVLVQLPAEPMAPRELPR